MFAIAIAAVLANPATGQAPAPEGAARMEPNKAGKGAKLVVDLVPPADQQAPPTAAVLAIARGFRFDRRARKRRCTPEQAASFDCPAKSRIGGGSAQVTASGVLLGGSRNYTATIKAFLAPPPQAGDKAGIVIEVSEPSSGIRRSSTARLVKLGPGGPFGYEVRVDSIPTPADLPLGITVRLDRLQLKIGAKRKVKRKRVKPNGDVVIKRKRRHLIRNPRTCTGFWPYELRLSFPSGERRYAGKLDCVS